MKAVRTPVVALAAALLGASILPAGAPAQVPDRSRPPELGPPPRIHLPPIQERRLSNGLRVVLMEKHEVPLVQMNLVVRAGSVMDPPGRYGLASMTADMMDEGAGELDALELEDAVSFLGARLSVSAGLHTSRVSLFTPLSKLDEALPLMADVLLRPRFPAEELERKRRSALTSLLQFHDEPTVIASVLFARTLYGPEHPYGRPYLTDEASIRAITVDDLRTFHDRYFRPNNAFLVVVGDVTLDDLVPRLEKHFGEWQPGEVPEIEVPTPRQVGAREVLLVDKPGAAQSVIRIGRIGVSRTTEDYYALVVMNTILGGSFTSRLNQNLREDKGYTYGARSSFSFRPAPGPFTASASVQTDVTGPSLTEFFRELEGIREPVPEEEVARARNYVALGFPAAFQSAAAIARQLEELVLYDLPEDYFDRYVDEILAVSPAQVREVARRYVDPGRVVVVVVGDRARIEEEVRALGLGPVRILTVEDVLGPKPEVGSDGS